MLTEHEEWRPIPGWEGFYEASSLGRIRSLARTVLRGGHPMRVAEKILNPTIDRAGYARVNFTGNGRREGKLVHWVIALAFHGPRPTGLEVRHRNGNSADNRAANLAYGTSSENKQDILAHGRHPHKNRTHCPAGHALVGTNLMAAELKRGHRKCRACSAAHSKEFRAPHLKPQFQALADEYYSRFTEAAA